MGTDPVVEDVRATREAYAAQYNFDLEAIFIALKQQEQWSDGTVVSLPPKQPKPVPVQKSNAGA